MKERLLHELLEPFSLSSELQTEIFRRVRRIKMDKNSRLETWNDKYGAVLVASGIIRYFTENEEGEETSLQFLLGGQISIIRYANLGSHSLIPTWITTIKPGVVYTLSDQDLAALGRLPGGAEFIRRLLEMMLIRVMDKEKIFMLTSNTARYQAAVVYFGEKISLIPQKALAAWLGISPVSLNRIIRKLKMSPAPLSPENVGQVDDKK